MAWLPLPRFAIERFANGMSMRMRTYRRFRRAAVSAAVLSAAVLSAAVIATLSGCTAAPAPTATPVATAAPAPSRANSSLPDATDIPNDPGLRKGVTLDACTRSGPDTWTASGDAHGASQPMKLTTTVFFVDAGNTVLGYAQTDVSVPAHGNTAWHVSAKVTGRDVRCVLRGVGKSS